MKMKSHIPNNSILIFGDSGEDDIYLEMPGDKFSVSPSERKELSYSNAMTEDEWNEVCGFLIM